MYIKNIVLDGFKSYRSRTEVSGFDAQFNAITGLNGSGKSNILDSICFVLGISNLAQVRAGNLQDLVFKNGQAGVTKATVTICFDNTDKEQCPPGYEDFEEITITRQVVMGGKNKYLINGSNVTNKRVQDLFCSIQLNINNPNFLIMQGRITKVLNMKPPEILSLIEEAAGTFMYEVKKQEVTKVIEKKDAKLSSLCGIMEEEIGPKLKKLKGERQQYLEFQRIERDLEHTNRLWVVWKLSALRKNREESEKNLLDVQREIEEKKQNIEQNLATITELENEMENINASIANDTTNGLEELESQLKDARKIEGMALAQLRSSKEDVLSEESKLKQLERDIAFDKKELAKKEEELARFELKFSNLKNEAAADLEALKLADLKYDAAVSGDVVDENGEVDTIQSLLINAQKNASEENIVIQQIEKEVNHALKELKTKEGELKAKASDIEKDKKMLADLKADVQKKEDRLAQLNYDEVRGETIIKRRRAIINRIQELRVDIDRFEREHPKAAFRYKPSSGRNGVKQGRVYGVVCQLLKVKHEKYCTALEVAASSKIYNIVVSNESSGKMVLESGQLRTRTTIIPINKVTAKNLDENKLRIAEKVVGSDNVFSCLSLVDHEPELEKVFQYVFGPTFIVKDHDVGSKLAFDSRINIRCITLDGDSCDPSGVLCGGSLGTLGTILGRVNGLRGPMDELTALEDELYSIEKEIESTKEIAEQYRKLKEQVDFAKHQLAGVEERLKLTDHYRLKDSIEKLHTFIEEMNTRSVDAKQKFANFQAKVVKIEEQMANIEKNRDKLLQDAQDELQHFKKKSEISRKLWEEKECEYKTLNLEIVEIKKSIDEENSEIEHCLSIVEKAKASCNVAEESYKQAEHKVTTITTNIKEIRSELAKKSKEVKRVLQRKGELEKENIEFKLNIQSLGYRLEEVEQVFNSCKEAENDLLDKNDWVITDTRYVSEIETYSEREKNALGTRFNQLKESHQRLARVVNARALALLEQEEDKYQELTKRKNTVEHDKKSIISVMKTLDDTKQKSIRKAWNEVNKNFSSIFQTLLPGCDAKLMPTNPKNLLEGFEVKVAFGTFWKDSLGELSGGQRSLVALSLILAMLKFKPAPLYILDEVDAALDLSHTQNIGSMLKEHFKNSQFIVVSLKDGMFNNANVLFRTTFNDGVSAVTRTDYRRSRIII